MSRRVASSVRQQTKEPVSDVGRWAVVTYPIIDEGKPESNLLPPMDVRITGINSFANCIKVTPGFYAKRDQVLDTLEEVADQERECVVFIGDEVRPRTDDRENWWIKDPFYLLKGISLAVKDRLRKKSIVLSDAERARRMSITVLESGILQPNKDIRVSSLTLLKLGDEGMVIPYQNFELRPFESRTVVETEA